MFNFNSLAVLVFGFLLQAQGLKCSPYADTSANGQLCLEEVCIKKGQLKMLLGLLGVKGIPAPAINAAKVQIGSWALQANASFVIKKDGKDQGHYTFPNSDTSVNFKYPNFKSVQIGNWMVDDMTFQIAPPPLTASTRNVTNGTLPSPIRIPESRQLRFYPVRQSGSVYRMRNIGAATNLWEKQVIPKSLTLKSLDVDSITIDRWELKQNQSSLVIRDTKAAKESRYKFTAGRFVDV